ncbi:hypothetical protein QJS04_geneDACA010663 [Acorus gramineus]|uniref:Uncharacterized protein n=1 Tax=Acorus gramineus TaxID=55184 RepID=A0AAV9AM84_ACOGR|nr:hypothetical protein QJS04_geneDACA010663 [Acorus gramineus]
MSGCGGGGAEREKRTREALERRFAAAKTELLETQNRLNGKKDDQILKPKEQALIIRSRQSRKVEGHAEAVKADQSGLASNAANRGHFAFRGHTPLQKTHGVSDDIAYGPSYFKLSQPIHEKLLESSVEFPSRGGNAVSRVIHDLLQNGDSAQKYMQGSRSMKIDNCILLDNYLRRRGSLGNARARAVQGISKRSWRHMSMKEHRKCGSFDFPKEFCNFELFKPMHEMWKDYITNLLKDSGKGQLNQFLLTADMHGAILSVVECKTVAYKGITGIMVRETSETFGIVTQDNKFQVVPKKGSVFIFLAGSWKITLYGDKLSSRNIDTQV